MTRPRTWLYSVRACLAGGVLYYALSLSAGDRGPVDWVVITLVVAAVGLVRDNTAVVIGAMLVAPLMTPLLGLGLAAAAAVLAALGVHATRWMKRPWFAVLFFLFFLLLQVTIFS